MDLEKILFEKGTLPYQSLEFLSKTEALKNIVQIGPSSFDLTIGKECYEIEKFIFPKEGQKVSDLFSLMKAKRYRGPELHPHKRYLIRIHNEIALPRFIYGYANPKSTTGRLFVHCRLVADGVSSFDEIPIDWRGELWLYVCPLIFSIIYYPFQTSFNQLRLFTDDTRLSQSDMSKQHQHIPLVRYRVGDESSLYIGGANHGYYHLTLDCEGNKNGGIIGYRARAQSKPVDLSMPGGHVWHNYFIPIYAKSLLDLEPGAHYILSSREMVRFPKFLCGELKEIDTRKGEFRCHYAGFFDSGFGYDPNDSYFGNTVTLEVTVNEPMTIWHGQPFASMYLEKMAEEPIKLYASASGTYAFQDGPRLAKYFTSQEDFVKI